MALHIRQDDKQSDLQRRIAAELQDKAKKRALEAERPDGVDDSRYIEGTKRTTGLLGAWVLIAIAAVGIAVWLTIISTRGL
jgi:hypothetical protein